MDAPMRSVLITPGHREAMVAKIVGGSLATPPDVTLLDLEDGVPPAEKENARRVIAGAIGAHVNAGAGPLRVVRLSGRSSSDAVEADLAAVVCPGLDAVMVPKVARAEEIAIVDEMIGARESAAGLERGAVKVIASIESAAALLDAARIARGPRVIALAFGSEDFSNDLGLPARREGEAAELLFARSAMVVAAASARVASIDGIWADFKDEPGLRKDSLLARRLGFGGRQCIHPDQIAVANEVFSPSREEIEHAGRVVAAFEDGVKRGLGAVALDGVMLDAPIVERARRTLRLARG